MLCRYSPRSDEIAQEHEVIALAAEHRIGTVLLASRPWSSPRARPSGGGVRRVWAAIDRIKERLPVWKVEIDADGEAAGTGPRRSAGDARPFSVVE